MAVYEGQLFAGTCVAGENEAGRVYRYDGAVWTDCGCPDRCNAVSSLVVYGGKEWEHLGQIEGASQTYGFATYRGDFYVSEWPHAKVFRWGGGTRWLPAGRLGDEKESMPLMVYNGKLYSGTLPAAEVYRYDQPDWTKVGRVDFTPGSA